MGKKKILVVEDEVEMRTLLALELETSNYEIFQAADSEIGLRMAEEMRPDLIIADVMMPKMDGSQFFKKLRATDFGRSVPFIVLTARGKMHDYFKTIEVDAFLSKPFEADELLAVVKQVLMRFDDKFAVSHQGEPVKGGGKRDTVSPAAKREDGKKRVMVVDNDLMTLVDLRKIFEDYGYAVKTVDLPSKCLEEVAAFGSDLIIAKYALDQITGDKLVELIRNMPQYKDLPIIIYADAIHGDEKEKSLQAGATQFCIDVKGIKLLKEVNQILES